MRSALKVFLPLGAAGAAVALGRSILHERRHPEPFPAARARLLESSLVRRQTARIVENLDLEPGMQVLDVGAGVGRLSIPVARRVGPQGEVVALDVQEEMLEILHKRAAEAGVTNIRTVRAPAGEGGLGNNTFDRALLVAVLGEIPANQRLPALREIREALRPDGILFVVEGPFDPHYQTRKAVARLGAEAGFKLLGTRRLGLARMSLLAPGRERAAAHRPGSPGE
jgi:ubiquinone/menaquinone biosynthesis C-methylase UbiE